MNDMSSVIVAKSDQLNADDLIAGPRTVVIRDVDIRPGTEQPVSIFYHGDEGKPYKCCKSMARVLVQCWGADASQYIGRSMTLYRDPKVLWGGMAVGGIRISHMSHITESHTMALTATKGSKKPFTVKPLKVEQADPPPPSPELLLSAQEKAAEGAAAYQLFWKVLTKPQQISLLPHHEGLKATAVAADAAKAPATDDTFPGDRP